MDYKVTIENHPAQKRDPFTNEPLTKDGNPVPLFPKEHCIKLNGKQIIAYLNEAHRITFIVPREKLGQIAEDAITLVKETFGESPAALSVPQIEPANEDA